MGLGLPVRGRPKRKVVAQLAGEVSTEDLALTLTARPPTPNSKPDPIKSLRATHHRMAQLLAAGYREYEVAAMMGYSPSRISVLKADPAFAELISFYRERREEIELDMHERLQRLALDAAQELSERLNENPDGVSTSQLMEVIKLGADRTGHGPSSSLTVRSFSLSAEDLRKLKEEVDGSARGRVLPKEDQEPGVGRIGQQAALAQDPAPGLPSPGDELRAEGGEGTGAPVEGG